MRFLFVVLILLTLSPVSWANESAIRTTFESEFLGETRTILVRLPADYSEDTKKSYPVLITLNDEDNFKWASSIVDVQSSRFGIEDMIVVGLPHSGSYSKDNYPFKKKGSVEPNPQAQNHAKFIREEALPYIEKNYRTNGGRFLVGHSLSGLFVINMFMQYPELFSTYVVLSPSVQHAPQLPGVLKEFFESNASLSGSVYVSMGDMEHQQIQQGYKGLKSVFDEHAPKGLFWTVNYMDNTDHLLAAFKGTYDSLTWIYRDWYLHDTEMQQSTLEDYITHYKSLSERLKYTIEPRERYLISFSGFAKKRLNDTNAAREALKAALYYYPQSQVAKEKLQDLEKTSL